MRQPSAATYPTERNKTLQLHDPCSHVTIGEEHLATVSERPALFQASMALVGKDRQHQQSLRLAPFNRVPLWSPRIWNGMQASHYGKLLAEHRYRIALSRFPSALVLVLATGLPSVLNRLQTLRFQRAMDRLPLVADPIFILGHWRTGTTLVHELLSKDEQLAAPNTFQCFMPRCFLVAQSWLPTLTKRLLPSKRPMDNMEMGWSVPQEDEFALLSMGLPTPYRRMAFPNATPRHLDYLNFNGVPRSERERWKDGLLGFIKALNYHYQRPMVLKSPPHTGRVSTLLEMFPQAKFIHVTRSPLEFIPSTMHLWASLDMANGFQLPNHVGLESYVFDSFERLYSGFFRDRHLLTAANSVSIDYRELVRQPVEAMRRIYASLNLSGFDRLERILQERQAAMKSYQRNRHELPPVLRAKIEDRCAVYMEEFGCQQDIAAA